MKPALKAPGTERLKLKYEELLFNFWFQIQPAAPHEGAVAAVGLRAGRTRVCGRGSHSFTSELKLSNSRTRS